MYSAIALSHYGSLEIKRAYRKNMLTGMITATMIMVLFLSAYNYFAATAVEPAITTSNPQADTIRIIDISIQRIYDIPKPVQTSTVSRPIPTAGIPTPVPDKEADNNSTVPSEDELKILISNRAIDSLGDLPSNAIIVANPDDILPNRDTFIAYDEPPKPIESVEPIYPEMARLAGVQGDVWVKALIDKNGNVRDVIISKESGASAGFEESAIAAARATSWKPAFSNGQPLAVWISYKISFRLK